MPVTPTYPGVYIQEVPSGVRTITSVATSIAAFLGRTTKGPINKAVRVLSLSDFERQFGEPYARSSLAASVQQFFNNGGTDCYVVRLANDPDFASVTLRSMASEDVLAVKAKAEGLWANTVRMEIDYNTLNPDETFNMTVIQEEGGNVVRTEKFTNLSMDTSSARYAPSFVSQSSELITLELSVAASTYNTGTFAGTSYGRRPLGTSGGDVKSTLDTLIGVGQSKFQISVNGSAYVTVDLATDPISATAVDIPDDIAGMINDALATVSPVETVSCSIANPGIGRMLSITSTSGDLSSVRVKRAKSEDISVALMLGVDQGGIEQVRWSNFRPAPTATMLRLGDPPTTPGDMTIVNDVAALAQTAITQITVDGETIQLDTVDYNLETNPGDLWHRNAAGNSTATGDNDGVREKLKIMADAINNNANLACKAEVWGYHLAIIPKDGTINKQITASTGEAMFDDGITENVRQYSLGTAGAGSFSTNGADGDDGTAPEYDDFIGSESAQTGFHALDPIDLFNLMILPEDEEVDESLMLSLWGPASTYCESRRAFLLIDAPASWTNSSTGRPEVVSDTSLINDLRASIVKDYAAVFYPRLKYSDSGVTKTIASAGAIAGLMARTDANRGVWKAPAGIEAGIRNVLGLNVELTDAENGVLNKKGVNCIRAFPNGIVNWGSRTLDGDDDFGSEWKYIPVRRLALNIEESLYRGTRWVVFEPNDEPLWAKIRLNVGAYMMSLFRQGAFQGTSPKEAFFVKCDKETTIQDDINKGIVNIRVGFAPLKPAEFVVITIQQMAGEL